MKFINYLETISGVAIYPMITLLLFFGFFTGLIIYVLVSKKEKFDYQSHLPLDDFEPTNSSNQ